MRPRFFFRSRRGSSTTLDIEAAFGAGPGSPGDYPPKRRWREIVRHCDAKLFDMAKLKTQTERIGYPVLPVVQQLVGLCKDGLGEWCHWGATTQDITDTATVLAIRERAQPGRKKRPRCDRRGAGRPRPQISRYADGGGVANLQQAVPLTFGFKAAVLLAGIDRHRATAEGTAPAGARRSVRRRRRHPGVARRPWPRGAGRADEGAEARSTRDRLAHHARLFRRGRLFSSVW